jgi:hypothetical protein
MNDKNEQVKGKLHEGEIELTDNIGVQNKSEIEHEIETMHVPNPLLIRENDTHQPKETA